MRVLVFALLVLSVSAHLWLDAPVSRRGTGSIGGTSGPCSNMAPGSGTRTTYTAGETVSLNFRINKHGPGPFRLALSPNGDDQGYDDPKNVLADNFFFKTNAPADGSEPFNLKFKIPDTPCDTCSIQLKGMAKADGTGTWYQCADIKILAAPCSTATCDAIGGTCQNTNCVCKPDFTGSDCSVKKAPANDKAATTGLTVTTSCDDSFDKAEFAKSIAASLAIPQARVSVTRATPVAGTKDKFSVVITIAPAAAGAAATEPTAAKAIQNLNVQYKNGQLDSPGYTLSSVDNAASVNGPATPLNFGPVTIIAAAGCALVLVAAVAFFVVRRRTTSGPKFASPDNAVNSGVQMGTSV